LQMAPEVKIVEGSSYFVIRDELKEYQPDLLAMGTHARSSLGTALVGSLARDLLTEATCSWPGHRFIVARVVACPRLREGRMLRPA